MERELCLRGVIDGAILWKRYGDRANLLGGERERERGRAVFLRESVRERKKREVDSSTYISIFPLLGLITFP